MFYIVFGPDSDTEYSDLVGPFQSADIAEKWIEWLYFPGSIEANYKVLEVKSPESFE